MGYSCWCSHLNLTIHIAKSPDHFPYSVTLGTKGLVISHLCTRAPFEAATSSTRGKSLYPTFVVYLRTIHGPISFTVIITRGLLSLMDILTFKELLRSFPNCFTNLSQIFRSVKFFLNFFLDLTSEYLSSPVGVKSSTNVRINITGTSKIKKFFYFINFLILSISSLMRLFLSSSLSF